MQVRNPSHLEDLMGLPWWEALPSTKHPQQASQVHVQAWEKQEGVETAGMENNQKSTLLRHKPWTLGWLSASVKIHAPSLLAAEAAKEPILPPPLPVTHQESETLNWILVSPLSTLAVKPLRGVVYLS